MNRQRGRRESDATSHNVSQTDVLDSYKSVLVKVHKAVPNGKVTLKCFEMIIGFAADLEKRSKHIANRLESLEQKKNDWQSGFLHRRLFCEQNRKDRCSIRVSLLDCMKYLTW